MKEGFVANHIDLVYGIINGTSNFILTKMAEDGLSFKDALALYASPVVSFDHDDYPELDLPEIEVHAANTVEELVTQLENDLTGVKDAHDLAVEAAENNILLLANAIQEKRGCEGACGNTECKCEGTCTCGGNCSKETEYNYDFS